MHYIVENYQTTIDDFEKAGRFDWRWKQCCGAALCLCGSGSKYAAPTLALPKIYHNDEAVGVGAALCRLWLLPSPLPTMMRLLETRAPALQQSK
jgi:hypothetical protein